MPQPSSKANYKSYEAQARMVRAIVAAHPEIRWNYKEISDCYGSDMTEHALNHRFRKIRAQCLIIKEGRAAGLDMKHLGVDENELPCKKEAVDKKNIAKYFGQSTGDGIQFQFRSIKKDAEMLRAVEKRGGDVSSCLAFNTTPSSKSARATPSRKRKSSDEDDEEVEEEYEEVEDWSGMDETPSKRNKKAVPGQKNGTPRRAAARANATVSQQLRKENEEEDEDKVKLVRAHAAKSIFGGDRKSPAFSNATINPGLLDDMTDYQYDDAYMSTTMNMGMGDGYFIQADFDGEGEI